MYVSAESRYTEFATCHKADVVLLKDAGELCAGEVWCHASVNGVPMSVASVWPRAGIDRDSLSATWRKTDDPVVIDTADILASVVWMDLPGGIVRTLIPREFV